VSGLLDRSASWMPLLGLLAVLGACDETTDVRFLHCTVESTLEPAAAPVGAEVVARGGPFTEAYDTTVQLDGVSAKVEAVERSECDECDDCHTFYGCTACEPCLPCTESCAPCEQTTTFTVPDVPTGSTTLVMSNRYGSTPRLDFTVEEAGDTGDAGDTDVPVQGRER